MYQHSRFFPAKVSGSYNTKSILTWAPDMREFYFVGKLSYSFCGLCQVGATVPHEVLQPFADPVHLRKLVPVNTVFELQRCVNQF